MPDPDPSQPVSDRVAEVYRRESRRALATLIRLLGGDFDVAEEALQDAFALALEQWPREGIPRNPRAWLVSAGRFRGIDVLRRRARFDASLGAIADRVEADRRGAAHGDAGDPAAAHLDGSSDGFEDDSLRLIFTCCHPALAPEARIALTLREVCGLTTDEIARAFLAPAPTVAQRIVRAKAKIRAAGIPYRVPSRADLPDRIDAVLYVVYLVFNEGYAASSGNAMTRPDVSGEAIRLGRLLVELTPDDPEVTGLLALMLLQESRRAARTSSAGELILLADQDRSLWDRAQIAEGLALVGRALSSGRFGPYALQAAIAAVHAEAADAAGTDWGQIVALYTLLLRAGASPVVELNRAVAVAMRDGPAAGLELIDAILARGELADYHLAHSARAAYARAHSLARQEPERQFLERRLRELG